MDRYSRVDGDKVEEWTDRYSRVDGDEVEEWTDSYTHELMAMR